MSDHADFDAIIVGKHVRRTIGTCRQYAEQSKAWQNGEGRSEDQHLQRIWNLADDSVTLIDFAHALVAERDEARRERDKALLSVEGLSNRLTIAVAAEARVTELEAALGEILGLRLDETLGEQAATSKARRQMREVARAALADPRNREIVSHGMTVADQSTADALDEILADPRNQDDNPHPDA
jgi:hypothetical protein